MSTTANVLPQARSASVVGGRATHLTAAACGILLGFLMLGTPFPADPAGTTAGAIQGWVAVNEGTLRWYSGSLSLSALLLVVFVAYLRGRVVSERPDARFFADAFVGTAYLCAAWLLVSGGATALLAFDPDALSDELAVPSYAVEALGDAVGTSALAARAGFLVFVGIAVLVARVLPRWLGWLALVLGCLSLAGGIGVAGEFPSVQPLFYVGLFSLALWPLAAGIAIGIQTFRSRVPAGRG